MKKALREITIYTAPQLASAQCNNVLSRRIWSFYTSKGVGINRGESKNGGALGARPWDEGRG